MNAKNSEGKSRVAAPVEVYFTGLVGMLTEAQGPNGVPRAVVIDGRRGYVNGRVVPPHVPVVIVLKRDKIDVTIESDGVPRPARGIEYFEPIDGMIAGWGGDATAYVLPPDAVFTLGEGTSSGGTTPVTLDIADVAPTGRSMSEQHKRANGLGSAFVDFQGGTINTLSVMKCSFPSTARSIADVLIWAGQPPVLWKHDGWQLSIPDGSTTPVAIAVKSIPLDTLLGNRSYANKGDDTHFALFYDLCDDTAPGLRPTCRAMHLMDDPVCPFSQYP